PPSLCGLTPRPPGSALFPYTTLFRSKRNGAGALHCASGAGRADGSAVVEHSQGSSCGPEKSGPPRGWLVTGSVASMRPSTVAVIVFSPSRRPVTRPTRRVGSTRVSIAVVAQDAHVLLRKRLRQPDLEQDVAAGDEIGACRERGDRDLRRLR